MPVLGLIEPQDAGSFMPFITIVTYMTNIYQVTSLGGLFTIMLFGTQLKV